MPHVAAPVRRASGRGGCVLFPVQHLHHRGPPQRQGAAGQLPGHRGQARRLPQRAGHLARATALARGGRWGGVAPGTMIDWPAGGLCEIEGVQSACASCTSRSAYGRGRAPLPQKAVLTFSPYDMLPHPGARGGNSEPSPHSVCGVWRLAEPRGLSGPVGARVCQRSWPRVIHIIFMCPADSIGPL